MKNQQKRPGVEDDTSDFPCDIVQNILSRLPVKSLLRFRTVSKPWNATIKDSGFAKIHFNQFNMSNCQCFFLTGSSFDGTYRLIKFEGQEFYLQSVVQFPSKELFQSAIVLCCCEGILLFQGSFSQTCQKFLLLNPFTRNYLTFSCHDIVHGSYSVSYGLCFDKYEDDYKVIVVSGDGKYLVYSIKNDSWAERQSEFRGYVNRRGTYADGVVYWILFQAGSFDNIIYFDPIDNLLKKLQNPGDSEPENKFVLLENYRGYLCFYTCDLEMMIEIWLLKESGGGKCWMKLSESPVSDSILVPHITPMYMTRDNDVVFFEIDTNYAVYCLERQKFVGVKEFPGCCRVIGLTCLESLYFPAAPRAFGSILMDELSLMDKKPCMIGS